MRPILIRIGLLALLPVLGAAGAALWIVSASLPERRAEVPVDGLAQPVRIESDRYGVPRIDAGSRVDAFRALGYLHARDRLFQMDLARRKSLGRLAELFGEAALALDRRQRGYQSGKAATRTLHSLPRDQREVLQAYADGVNSYLRDAPYAPVEALMLRYRPEPWRPEDSLLIAFGMFQTLTDEEADERMLTVMNATLRPELVAFLTPDTDRYARPLLGGDRSWRPPGAIPVAAIAEMLAGTPTSGALANIRSDEQALGSNQWVVGARKTRDGRAIVADDMHLPLGVPNVWYRAELHYPTGSLSGVTLAGLPLVVAGRGGSVAWGFTNVYADVFDLVQVETDPRDPMRYRIPGGWATMQKTVETIEVRDHAAETVEIHETIWGPLAPEPVLGHAVALRWTALEPAALNLGLLELDHAAGVTEAIDIVNQAGIPPQNVVLADTAGHIGWTYAGLLPRRRGGDGSHARSWADGSVGWNGFVPAEDLPRLVDPPSGFIATANNRTLGTGHGPAIGHNYSSGYRAFRIAQRLDEMSGITEQDLLDVQLDTRSDFFEFYRRLVLALPADAPAEDRPLLDEAREDIARWNGRFDTDSHGIALLIRFRRDLSRAVFGRLLAACTRADADFSYQWRQLDVPLQALLTEQIPETLPDRRHATWPAFIRSVLLGSAHHLKTEFGVARLDELRWGRVNTVRITHPFSRAVPWLSSWLDMPSAESAGCAGYCVRVLADGKGASERFVISPAHPEDGIFHMPAGQSGHFLSGHYRDQHPAWADGLPLPFETSRVIEHLGLVPRQADGDAMR